MMNENPECTQRQLSEADFTLAEDDFELAEKELKQKYGDVYKETELTDETPKGMTRRDFLRLAVVGTTATLAAGSVGSGAWEFWGRKAHEAKMTVGKNNPILAAQSQSGMIFKADFGDTTTHTGSVEQVILWPTNQDGQVEEEKEEIQTLFQQEKIDGKEFQRRMTAAEFRKEQGFISADKKEIINFEELLKEIKEKGQRGIKTTLNFGDSSTSGWNSDVLTENAVSTVKLLYNEIRNTHPELPETFEGYCLQREPIVYQSKDRYKVVAAAAEAIKQLPEFNQIVAKNWEKVRQQNKSPFLTYDTYTDKAAKIDTSNHEVNLGVPGYSSTHLKSYVKRMLQKFQTAGVLQYIDSVTLYIGNNDCVYNGNAEDKYYVGEDTNSQLHGVGLLKEYFPKLIFTSRVSPNNYQNNLDETVQLLKAFGIKNIVLTVPVVPLDWRPGLRAANDAQNVVDAQYAQQGKASALFNQARDKYADYLYEASRDLNETPGTQSGAELSKFGQAALESDPMVPRIKANYVQIIGEVAAKNQVALVNLNPVLPARDMSHMNTLANNWQNISVDYCHPSEHSNTLIAYALSLAKNSKEPQIIRALAKQELIKLGLTEALAEKELQTVEQSCVVKQDESTINYRRLSSTTRTRKDWNIY